MHRTNLTMLVALGVAAVALGGCCDGMKTTFINQLDKPIEPNYRTSGPENFRVVVGKIEPGEDVTTCIELEPMVLPADFTVTVFEATPDQLQHIVRIPKDYPEKLTVTFSSDPDLGVVIRIVDDDGTVLKRR